jgi:hypothetical protein
VYVKIAVEPDASDDPSFWRSHAHSVGPLIERSVNVTASGAGPTSGDAVKSATGSSDGCFAIVKVSRTPPESSRKVASSRLPLMSRTTDPSTFRLMASPGG